MPRAFIAVHVQPPAAVGEVLRRLEAMGSALRPCSAQDLHLTLAFLGETDESRFDDIAQAMSASCQHVPCFDLELAGLGAFPSPHRPNNVWIGAKDGHPLSQIVDDLRPRLNALGISTDDRPWRAHLTLARVKFKPPPQLAQLLRTHHSTAFGSSSVREILLMTSQLLPHGPRHAIARTVSLPG